MAFEATSMAARSEEFWAVRLRESKVQKQNIIARRRFII
jgi:hypothetical protein